MARRSSHITSRLESCSLGRSRRTCVSNPQRRRWCRWRRGWSQGVDVETTSCYFACFIDHTFGRYAQSLRAIGACGVEDPRLKPGSLWMTAGWPPSAKFSVPRTYFLLSRQCPGSGPTGPSCEGTYRAPCWAPRACVSTPILARPQCGLGID